jgi:2-amino-4-hydroxy-6-hydroxymethyldihydropteridine diphosphokinase
VNEAREERGAPGANVFIAIGSNIEPERNIARGLELLNRRVRLQKLSTIYRTMPQGRPGQAPYLNGVCAVKTSILPRLLKFAVLREIEHAVGRTRSRDKYASRELDLDILIYDTLISEQDGLRLPDPDIRTRLFVAAPLLELSPDLVLPDTGEGLAGVVDVLRRQGGTQGVPDLSVTQFLRERLDL